ncbi:hypothetical protein [Rhodalgimonas zhirmunskyi]|uniref:Uncharacterized protein n=1 Tax=Rhodalgimonas zhirmunskyi TaxID=2964767 RepID=A0AAJ1X4X4_9RHOB|nr:hypothetical protein [Rhodoalgimonas zhirmunskyi]MDQ2093574.1 hypothetical protein [Rhodoalgimonas zhirmunskyi]
MLGFMSMSGRGSPLIAVGLVLFSLQVLFGVWVATGYNGGGSDGGPTSDALNRPSLSSHLPPTLPGWHKRTYLPADGEQITAAAKGRGIEARLAQGTDLEQFRLYEKAGVNGAAAVYVEGAQMIAVGITRDPAKTPDWVDTKSETLPWAAQLRRLELGEVIALVHGLAFQRRDGASVAGAGGEGIGYGRYVARVGHDLQIDVISNAPQQVVEQLIGRLDAAALAQQLTEPSTVLDPEKGVILQSFPVTWPEGMEI